MIRYSKPRIIILIIVLIALWAAVGTGLSLPFADKSEVRLTVDGARLTVHSSSSGDTAIMASGDSNLYIEIDGELNQVTGESAVFTDVDDITLLVPESFTSISFNGISDVGISGIVAETIALSSVSADLEARDIRADEVRLTTVDGDIDVVGSSASTIITDTVNGDTSIQVSDATAITAHTINGDISIDVDEPESYTRTILSPSFKATLPSVENSSLTLRAETVNGEVEIF